MEQDQNLIVDARVENEGNGWSGSGANPWHLDADTDSVLFLTNMGDKPCPIAFKVTANGIHYYLTNLTLNPHETRAIDIRALRDAQKPDFMGDKIPAIATDGSVNWDRGALVPVEGRMIVINRRGHMANSYDCNPSNCPASPKSVVLSCPGAIVPGSGLQCTHELEEENCNYDVFYGSGGGQCTWTSGNTGILTVDSSGWVNGVGGGSAYIYASVAVTDYSCNPTAHCEEFQSTAHGSTSKTVQVPCAVGIVSGTDHTTPESQCSVQGEAGCGVTRTFHYQLMTGCPGTPTAVAVAVQVWDTIQVSSAKNGLGMIQPNTTCTNKIKDPNNGTNEGPCGVATNSSGQYSETLTDCATACWSGSTCVSGATTAAAQVWHAGSTALPTTQLTYECNKVQVNGH